jgi:hypothetical protein
LGRGLPHALIHDERVFLGPRLIASAGKISGEIAAEFPLLIDNTALQVVPDYRLRASIAVRF